MSSAPGLEPEFCPQCGAELDDEDEWVCSECQAIADGLLKECPKCGTAIALERETCVGCEPKQDTQP